MAPSQHMHIAHRTQQKAMLRNAMAINSAVESSIYAWHISVDQMHFVSFEFDVALF